MIQQSIAIEGRTFGQLHVIKEVSDPRKGRFYLCQCSCGKAVIAQRCRIIAGRVKSCGCLRGKRTFVEKPQPKENEA